MSKKTNSEVVFYEYPKVAYIACTGVTVTYDKTGVVWGFQSKEFKPVWKRSFDVLCIVIRGLGVDLPERFGLKLLDVEHKGMTLKPSGLVVIKPTSPLEAKADTISFQFKKGNISSFTAAITNATKAKKIFYDYQLSLRSVRDALHESISL
tara:strand:+ start:364 stop:816 length:453 start_codon:yes stop_codon:yes gene_type:complete